jgi:hypothetical protein
MSTPEAVLRLDGMTITTTDEVCVRTLWKLMGTALRPEDVRQLEGARPAPAGDSTRSEDR